MCFELFDSISPIPYHSDTMKVLHAILEMLTYFTNETSQLILQRKRMRHEHCCAKVRLGITSAVPKVTLSYW